MDYPISFMELGNDSRISFFLKRAIKKPGLEKGKI
jgi:hypothetical protein